jgi:hypothetical protein
MGITKDEFQVWKAMPETQEALKVVDMEIKELVDALSTGGTINTDSIDTTLINTLFAVGRIKGLRKLIEMEHEDQ